MKPLRAALAVLALTLAAATVDAGATFEVFEIHYSNAAQLESAVRALLSEEGKVSVNAPSNALIVKDRPEVIEQVRRLIARLDRKPKNIRINVEFIEKSRLKELGFDVRWRVSGPGWSVGVFPGSTGSGASVTAEAATARLEGKKKQTLLIMEGRPGRIFVGESVPFTSYVIQYGVAHGYIEKDVTFKEAGTQFSVTARTTGDGKIHLRLEPEVSSFDRRRGSFSVKSAATTLVVDDPGAVVIGGSDDAEESFGVDFLRGIDHKDRTSSFVMILSVRSED